MEKREIYSKAMSMIRSQDIEMIRLGAILMLEHASMATIQRYISYSVMSAYNQPDRIDAVRQWTYEDYIQSNRRIDSNNLEDEIWIKGNKCIAVIKNVVIAKSLGLFKIHQDFERIKKIYYD